MRRPPLTRAAFAFLAAMSITATPVLAHCDGLDGPVVNAARKALETQNVRPVLIWVQEADEPEIRRAFKKTLAVRKLNAEARELADHYFFETVVRVHRAGEGAPYTGLKPAGRDLGPAIPAADRAIAEGSAQELSKLLIEALRQGLHKRFQDAVAVRDFSANDVKAGRDFVKAYVEFVHYVERIYEAATSPSGHHAPAPHTADEPACDGHTSHSLQPDHHP